MFTRLKLQKVLYIYFLNFRIVGCSPSDIVLLPNVTTGLNAVMRSMDLKKGDVVYRLNIEYGMFVVH